LREKQSSTSSASKGRRSGFGSNRDVAFQKLDVFAGVGLGFLAVVTFGVAFPGINYLLDFLSNFRIAACLLALLVCCYCIFLRRSSAVGIISAVLFVVNARGLFLFFTPTVVLQPGEVCSIFQVSQFNLSGSVPQARSREIKLNEAEGKESSESKADKPDSSPPTSIDYNKIGLIAKRENADLLVFTSLKPDALQSLSSMLTSFPYRETSPSRGAFGLGVFSRLPLSEVDYAEATLFKHPILEVKVEHRSGSKLSLIVANSPVPIEKYGSRAQKELFAAIATKTRGSSLPVVTVGDFKSSPWTAAFRDLTTFTGLQNAASGKVIAPTWPAENGSFFKRLFLGQIFDNTLYTNPLVLASHEVQESVGSSHFPLHTRFLVPCSAMGR